ncbi:TetR-family transcriptional regulator [Streptomyces himastatinicus ATCC 53653]|uniref:TetR-family transcriptional regulator n=1 Tax=Streptomyces himastatinicus ATCC 53653 TaxID=457427 RepID=D9W6Q8_9ACTN|nr:TetR/AcrR family transcriptional regulator [Streptomyces himastatinicus]EFL24572.1 TetR-family transcriptional regulator [Streptomyces himastatinicus ATCC 53653]
MSSTERRERERARRHQLIITAARELAEAEGWDAVTTRRLAQRVAYSQPVLYNHFKGKDAIVGAVAVEGFDDLAAALRRARRTAGSPREALRAVGRAYLDFAVARPALYAAMFVRETDVPFAQEAQQDSPAAPRAAFEELAAVAGPGDGRDAEVDAEVIWSALHGLAVLARSGRIPQRRQRERLDALVERFAPDTAGRRKASAGQDGSGTAGAGGA